MNLSALLLAGGQSRRMGRDKAGVLMGGLPLWKRQLALLQGLSPEELLISGKPDGLYAGAGFEIVVDDTPELGPLGGIVTALRRARFPLLLVLAIDLANMRASLLRELVDVALSSARGVVARGDRGFEPLAAVYPVGSLPLAEECLRGDDRSLQCFVRRAVERGFMQMRELRACELSLFRNVNSPEDL